ncbi:DapH/DapD/GlmU-related protein [Albimonas sp. CAU 1670]|uniref:DapH/DapD/GlmU-related protein n=1 Tax=Albimonas sp. CAU 1670 TaxID=3032599 RepID=UPI0023DC781B|nr:DapH/DapD/GlmU-related protein [Albimonas sp. CAU 1670]MDF2233714.1 DapH/DapD/GlmU-related protein [Albimonas sp. CAU 1670]
MARLSESPWIDPTSRVIDSRLGAYTEVMAGSWLLEVDFGDYSYCAGRNEIAYSRIGKFANIASGCRICPTNHPYQRASLHHFMYRASNYWDDAQDEAEVFEERRRNGVTIGHDTWFGYNAIIMPGVTVGTGAIVAAGAVVTRDVAPYTIVGGVAASEIKPRFPARVAERLLALAWWDWDHATLRARLDDFRSLPVEAFLEKYERA